VFVSGMRMILSTAIVMLAGCTDTAPRVRVSVKSNVTFNRLKYLQSNGTPILPRVDLEVALTHIEVFLEIIEDIAVLLPSTNALPVHAI
jgi:hypothetical protein